MKLVRYADDFVVMVNGTRDDAQALWDELDYGKTQHSRVVNGRQRVDQVPLDYRE